jgi:hypothetical protein
MKRKYKCSLQQGVYDSSFKKGADDFMRRRGGSLQCSFMDGYKGFPPSAFNGEKTSCAWACYMAGKDRKDQENKGKILPAIVRDKRLLEVR